MQDLNPLYKLYENYRKENPFFGQPVNLYESMEYIMELGGKRVRPLLTLASCLSAGGDAEAALPIAHAMEVFHNFSLVHDDIMDNADLRRGHPTVHKKWDTNTAILAGDNLFTHAVHSLNQYKGIHFKEILGYFIKTSSEVCEGQQMDMEFAQSNEVTEGNYLEMIRLKTAVLLGCSAACGALAGNAGMEKAQKYYDFAIALGIAFQLDDDYLDTFGDSAKTGKKTGGDIAEGKKTLLYIAARAYSEKIEGIYSIENTEHRIQKARELYLQLGLDTGLKKLASQYSDKAAEILQELALSGQNTQWLVQIAEMLGNREN